LDPKVIQFQKERGCRAHDKDCSSEPRTLAPDGTPVRRRYFSSSSGKELEPEAMVRSYEMEGDRYVVVTDDEPTFWRR
jgi:hypothetical protein